MRVQAEHSSGYAVTEVPGLFVVENEALERLLFDRNCIGLEFSKCCLQAVRLMLAHLVDDLNAVEAELLLLSKGLLYQLGTAVPESTGRQLPMNLVATRRAAVTAAGVRIEVPYVKLDNAARRLIIGDTVASGATIVAALDAYLRHYPLEALYLVSFAGSLLGARHIQQYCAEFNIELTMVFGLAAFGLGSNGFDLSFLHPDTVTHSRYRERARAQFDGRPVSAVGWDFGSQAMAPTKYRQLCWMEAEFWGLVGHSSFAVARKPDDATLLGAESAAFQTGEHASPYPSPVEAGGLTAS